MFKKSIFIIVGALLVVVALVSSIYLSTSHKNTAQDPKANLEMASESAKKSNISDNSPAAETSPKSENTIKDNFNTEILASDLTGKEVSIDSTAQVKDIFKNEELKANYNVGVDPCKLLDTEAVKKKLQISQKLSIYEEIRFIDQLNSKEKSLVRCFRSMASERGDESLKIVVTDFSTQDAGKLNNFQNLFKLVYGVKGFTVDGNLIRITESTNINSKQAQFYIGQYYIELVSLDQDLDNFESFVQAFYLEIKK